MRTPHRVFFSPSQLFFTLAPPATGLSHNGQLRINPEQAGTKFHGPPRTSSADPYEPPEALPSYTETYQGYRHGGPPPPAYLAHGTGAAASYRGEADEYPAAADLARAGSRERAAPPPPEPVDSLGYVPGAVLRTPPVAAAAADFALHSDYSGASDRYAAAAGDMGGRGSGEVGTGYAAAADYGGSYATQPGYGAPPDYGVRAAGTVADSFMDSDRLRIRSLIAASACGRARLS